MQVGYGLRQAPRDWYVKSDKQFKQSFSDSNIYIKSKDGDAVILMIYVDGIIITESEVKAITKVKSELYSAFDMIDLGLEDYCSGVQQMYLCFRN